MMFVIVLPLALFFLRSCVHGSALPDLVFNAETADFEMAQHFLATQIDYDSGLAGKCSDSQKTQVMQEFLAATKIMNDATLSLKDGTNNYGSMLQNFVPPDIRSNAGEVRDIAQGYYGYVQYLDTQPPAPVIKLTCNAASPYCTDQVNKQAVAAYWDPVSLNMNLCSGFWDTPKYNGDLTCTKDMDLRYYDSRARILIHELMHNAAFLYIGGKVDYAREVGGTYGPWCCKQLANSATRTKDSNSNADNYAWLAVGLHYLGLCKNIGNPPTIPVDSDRGKNPCPFQT